MKGIGNFLSILFGRLFVTTHKFLYQLTASIVVFLGNPVGSRIGFAHDTDQDERILVDMTKKLHFGRMTYGIEDIGTARAIGFYRRSRFRLDFQLTSSFVPNSNDKC